MKTAKPGLSLMEVLLAVLIIGISVTGILSFQGTLSRSIFRAHGLIERMSFILSYFTQGDREQYFKQDKKQTKELKDPVLTLTYSVTKPTSKELKDYDHLKLETVEATWPGVFSAQMHQYTQARFVPPGAQKEKKNE